MSAIATAAAAALAKRAAELAAQEQAARVTAARLLVGNVLSPDVDPNTLEVCDDGAPIILGDGTVCLAAAVDGVHLVTLTDGQWQDLAGPLADLAELGAALAGQQ